MIIESRPCSRSLTAWSKGSNPHSLVKVGSRSMWTPYLWNQNKCVTEQWSTPLTRYESIHQPDTQSAHQNHQVNAHHINHVIGWNTTLQTRPPPPQSREGRGIGWLSVRPPVLYAPQYWWNGLETAEWVAWSFPLLKAVSRWELAPSPDLDVSQGNSLLYWETHEHTDGCTDIPLDTKMYENTYGHANRQTDIPSLYIAAH